MKANYDLHANEHAHDNPVQCEEDAIVAFFSTETVTRGTTAHNLIVGDPMKNFEKRPLIRGADASNMSDHQVLDVIADIDAQIKALESAATSTETAKQMVKDLKTENGRIVKYLDGRNSD